ncbi:MAG: PIG-L family deacetylase [Terrimonas sp.]|nr:PIG-L family deacetylase [Terrimonas sp.]
MKRIITIVATLLFAIAVFPQRPVSWSSADMYLAIKKLNVLGSVLYVAAHPDDENTRLIAYLSKDKLYRTGYLAMTRGDGGQNLIGDEQGIELGLIRTQELLSARRMDGGEQFFTRAFDFGYSKNPEETFTKWDKNKILSDVVWVIRKFRPDVIVTRFPTTGEGGHGHHTASAILANEAFTAAADPNRFPEQLKYVQPWQAKRILWNTFNFGGTNTTSESQFKIDVGGYNPLLGKSYGEIAAESRSQHKSQGFGVPGSRGESFEYFKTTGGSEPRNSLTDAVDISWNRIPGGGKIQKMIDAIAAKFDLLHPEQSVKGLTELYGAILSLPANPWQVQKLKEVKELIGQCSGLWLDAYTNDRYAVQTDSVQISFSVNNRLGVEAVLNHITLDQFDTAFSAQLEKNKNLNFSKNFFVPSTKNISQPYWLVNKMEEGYYNVTNQEKIGQPDVDPAYTAHIFIRIYGREFDFNEAVKYRHTDPVRGELYDPVVVVPPVIVSPDQLIKMSRDKNEFQGILSVTPKKQNITAELDSLQTQEPDSYRAIFSPSRMTFYEKEKARMVNYDISATKDNAYDFLLSGNGATAIKSYDLHEISYDHIPHINYFHDASVVNRKLDLKTYNKTIGYIVGAGDKVPEALEQMGYEVTLLTEKELARNNLGRFDAIITGVRTYNTNDWMGNYYDKLMQYVEDGGNLIVQYNTSNFISNVASKIGPYDFTISRNRITDEKARVKFLQPDHPALNFPNKLSEDDFRGWIQERSIYDAIKWDQHFTPILSMQDPGDRTDEGSLIVADYGKGKFVYTGLVFFRELPAGVPGAYRLLANLIALNRKKAF